MSRQPPARWQSRPTAPNLSAATPRPASSFRRRSSSARWSRPTIRSTPSSPLLEPRLAPLRQQGVRCPPRLGLGFNGWAYRGGGGVMPVKIDVDVRDLLAQAKQWPLTPYRIDLAAARAI